MFGNTQLAKEDVRAEWGWLRMEQLVRDVRHGLRQLRRSPGFAAITIATMAIGIGANTAIVSIVNGVLLRPLAYVDPSRLMFLTTKELGPVSVPEYLEFQALNHSFSDVGAFRTGEVNLSADDRARRVRSAFVDAHLLSVLGLRPAQGRGFTNRDTVAIAAALPGASALAQPVALVSYTLWQSAFGGRPILNHQIDIDGRHVEIVGIMARDADVVDYHPDVWLPLGFSTDELRARNNHNLVLIGRLKNDIASAKSELSDLAGRQAARAGGTPRGTNDGHTVHALLLVPLADQILGHAGQSVWLLQTAAGLLLLLACVNVANLLLARAEVRRREFAVLTALGAGRGRLFRKVLTESTILALCGGMLGVVLARGALDVLIHAYPSSLPRLEQVTVDVRVLIVSFVIATLCGLAFGIVPMAPSNGTAPSEILKSGSRGSAGVSRRRARRALVIAETALAVVIVVAAGLLLRTVWNLTKADAGFDRSRLVTFSVTLPRTAFNNLDRVRAYQEIVEKLRAVPGVTAASAMSLLPLDRQFLRNATELTGSTYQPTQMVPIDYQRVMSGFFEATRVPILQGRGFQPADAADPGGVAVINETMARIYWGGRNPIGQHLRPGGTTPWFTVIGVAKDVKQAAIDQPVGPEAYLLIDQLATDSPTTWVAISPTTMHLVVRTVLPPASLAPSIARVVRGISPNVPVAKLRDMEDVLSESIRRPRLLAQLVSTFGVLALLLAAIGTYGVLSYAVTAHRREIGVRMALGAGRYDVIGQVLKDGLLMTSIGLGAGIAAALGLAHLMKPLLFDVSSTDGATLAAVALTLAIIAAIAAGLPAWRASRVDPNIVLREE
jgi:predicted permease